MPPARQHSASQRKKVLTVVVAYALVHVSLKALHNRRWAQRTVARISGGALAPLPPRPLRHKSSIPDHLGLVKKEEELLWLGTNENNFRIMFRFTPTETLTMARLFCLPPWLRINRSRWVSAEWTFCVFLGWMTGLREIDLGTLFNIDAADVSRLIKYTMAHVAPVSKFLHDVRYIPNLDEYLVDRLPEITSFVNRATGTHPEDLLVYGFVDGVVVKIAQPSRRILASLGGAKTDVDPTYTGEHCAHYLNLLATCLPDGSVVTKTQARAASCNDHMLQPETETFHVRRHAESGTFHVDMLGSGPGPSNDDQTVYQFGDKGFHESRFTTVYKPDWQVRTTDWAARFNEHFKTVRIEIEHIFRELEINFCVLSRPHKLRVFDVDCGKVQRIIDAAFVLMECKNCFRPNQVSQFSAISPLSLERRVGVAVQAAQNGIDRAVGNVNNVEVRNGPPRRNL